jgi:hypothetical protein
LSVCVDQLLVENLSYKIESQNCCFGYFVQVTKFAFYLEDQERLEFRHHIEHKI